MTFLALIAAATLAQTPTTQAAIRRTTPATDDPGMVVRQVGTVNVNCAGCAMYSPDGGNIGIVNQGPGRDGGPWEVYVVNPSGGGGGGTSSNFGAAFPTAGTAAGFYDGTNMSAARTYDSNSGVTTENTLGVMLRASGASGSVETGTSSNPIRTDPTGTTTQPVSAASLPLPTGAATSALQTTGNTSLSSIDTKTPALVSGRVPVDGSGVTQPISAAALPLPTGAATSANQTTVGSQTTKINDGTNTAAVKAASTAAGATDPALVVAISPNNTVAVSGTVTANAGTGTFTVGQSTAANLRAQTSSESNTGAAAPTQGSLSMGNTTTAAPSYSNNTANALSLTTAGALRTDSSATTQPVSGTVAATQSGTWSTRTQDGAGNALASSTSAPTGTEQGLITRNIPSGTQTISGSVTVSGTPSENLAQVNGATVNVGSGAASTGTQRVILATDQPVIPVSDNGGSITVDGTVAATQSGTWSVRTQDGSGNALASATTTPAGTEQALIVRNIPSGTQTVSGTVAATQSGTWNITNVSGTVSLPTGASTAANQTTIGSQTTKINDGTNTAAVKAASTAAGATDPALVVAISPNNTVAATQSGTWNITDVSGTVSLPTGASTSALQATGNTTLSSINTSLDVSLSTRLAESTFTGRFPASASLTDNFANPTVTGVGSFGMVWDGATWDRMPGTSVDGVLVNLGANNDVTVTGTVTATQATASNLRTQTASESATNAAAPSMANYNGYRDSAGNIQPGLAIDTDTSGSTIYTQGVSIVGASFGSVLQSAVESTTMAGNTSALAVRPVLRTASAIASTSVSCATTATQLPASSLSGRQAVCITNNGSNTIYLGPSGVTTSNGYPLTVGSHYCAEVNSQQLYYCIVAAGTENARVLEN